MKLASLACLPLLASGQPQTAPEDTYQRVMDRALVRAQAELESATKLRETRD